jgi:hypothetical protein
MKDSKTKAEESTRLTNTGLRHNLRSKKERESVLLKIKRREKNCCMRHTHLEHGCTCGRQWCRLSAADYTLRNNVPAPPGRISTFTRAVAGFTCRRPLFVLHVSRASTVMHGSYLSYDKKGGKSRDRDNDRRERNDRQRHWSKNGQIERR